MPLHLIWSPYRTMRVRKRMQIDTMHACYMFIYIAHPHGNWWRDFSLLFRVPRCSLAQAVGELMSLHSRKIYIVGSGDFCSAKALVVCDVSMGQEVIQPNLFILYSYITFAIITIIIAASVICKCRQYLWICGAHILPHLLAWIWDESSVGFQAICTYYFNNNVR